MYASMAIVVAATTTIRADVPGSKPKIVRSIWSTFQEEGGPYATTTIRADVPGSKPKIVRSIWSTFLLDSDVRAPIVSRRAVVGQIPSLELVLDLIRFWNLGRR